MSFPILLIYFLAAAGLVAVDQLSKLYVSNHLADGTVVTAIPHVLQFRYVQNTGAAFSVLTGQTAFLSVLTGIILVVVIVLLVCNKVPGRWNQVAVVLMVAGGFGNLMDRIFRHFVVDFMEVTFTTFAVFNFADCCVTIGAAILVLSSVISIGKEMKEKEDRSSDNA